MGTAKNQRIYVLILQFLQILGDNQLCDRVAVIEVAVFHQRHKHRARLGKNLHLGQHITDYRRVGAAAHRGRRADDADPAVAGCVHRSAGRCPHHPGEGHRQAGGLLRRIGRGHRAAGGNDEFHVPAQQKADILPGVLDDDILSAGAVGHAARIPEVDDILPRQHAAQLPHSCQAAQTAVKHADGPCVHQYAPFRRFTASVSSLSTSSA